MIDEHKRQTVAAHDGTLIYVEWTRRGELRFAMAPGVTNYITTCATHGHIDTSYEGLSVGLAADDHAKAWHGGLSHEVEVVDL